MLLGGGEAVHVDTIKNRCYLDSICSSSCDRSVIIESML